MEKINQSNYESTKTAFMEVLKSSFSKSDASELEKSYTSTQVNPAEKIAIMDFGFREFLKTIQTNNLNLEKVLDLSIEACRKEICSPSLPVLLLSDMFDTSTISMCETLFKLVENRVDVWKDALFFTGCKNHLLRCSNDLLRRLSRSQNTVFCGRILMFLATLFPLSERSGLNIAGEFNVDNTTQFSTKDTVDLMDSASDLGDGMEEGEMDESNANVIVDYNMYRKFWELQEFFRDPNQLHIKIPWKKFTRYSDDVLAAFHSFKLDHVKSSKWKNDEDSEKNVYFAKYLTGPKLLDLEMSDTNFRRYVLLQFLILFQYLTSNVKFKTEKKLSLMDDQNDWIIKTEKLIYELLDDTPPDGMHFSKCVKHILQREDHWNNWKNEGCPNFDLPVDPTKVIETELKKPSKTKKRPAIGDVIREATNKKRILMGNAELTRLWNLCPNNMEACRSEKRNFMPNIENYFDEAIEQCKPEHQIEDQYKLIHEPNFGWKSLRVLSRQSHHFFNSTNQPAKSVPFYLEMMMSKLAKELPKHVNSNDVGISIRSEIPEMANQVDSEDELLNNEESNKNSGSNEKSPLMTLEQVSVVAPNIGNSWKLIASHLGFQEDEVLFFESEHPSSVTEQARKMLLLWTENNGEDATIDAFISVVKKLKLPDEIIDIFNSSDINSDNCNVDESNSS